MQENAFSNPKRYFVVSFHGLAVCRECTHRPDSNEGAHEITVHEKSDCAQKRHSCTVYLHIVPDQRWYVPTEKQTTNFRLKAIQEFLHTSLNSVLK